MTRESEFKKICDRHRKSKMIMAEQPETAKRQLGWYVRNCAMGPMAEPLERILLSQLKELKRIPEEDDPAAGPAKVRRHRLRELHRVLQKYAASPSSGDDLEQNALFARDEFALDAADIEILLLLLRYERNCNLERFADEVAERLKSVSRGISALTGIDNREVHRRIMPGGSLIDGGILTLNEESRHGNIAGPCGCLVLSPPLRKLMFRPYGSREEWSAAILGPPLCTTLAWEDFAHLGPVRDLAARVVAGASKGKAKGINLLWYGPVGTGKTEFCKVLAAKTGMAIWSIGEADREGEEPTRGERLASLRLALRLLAKRPNALVLLDEAEDLLEQPRLSFAGLSERNRNGSKVYINRLIEQNSVPLLWTCNEVETIDPAVMRRMSLAVEVRTPNQPVRAQIWRRILSETQIQLDENAVHGLSKRYQAPPAVAANAVRTAALAGGGEVEIEQAMNGVLQILGISPSLDDAGCDFDAQLVNCSENLSALVDGLTRPGAPLNWSMCLHGAPGTGKSQFARHLATSLGFEVMQQRASDLLSMWVGGSEKKIAAAFATARTQRSMLIIDEADSLLFDRRDAVRSWEISQVNEMLTWMENHPLPFICTTNLVDRLDQASLRRFTVKLRFDLLNSTQAARAFEHFFGNPAPHALPDGLTPGDFATVRRKRDVLGTADAAVLAGWLDEELEAKGKRIKTIGFVPPRV
jgi:transitional endoplasmic reticulum ATPase